VALGSVPEEVKGLSPVDKNLSALFVALFERTSAAKSLLADIVRRSEDVGRYLNARAMEEVRGYLDFHISAMALLGCVKKQILGLVIRHINYHTSELFGWGCKMLTPLADQSRHPFYDQLFEGASVCAPLSRSRCLSQQHFS